MLFYAGSNVNSWLEKGTQNKCALFLNSGEVPASVKELAGKRIDELYKDAVTVLELAGREAGSFSQFVQERVIKRPLFKNANRMIPERVMLAGIVSGYQDKQLPKPYASGNHYTHISLDGTTRSIDFGGETASKYNLMIQMPKPVHIESLDFYMEFASSSSSPSGSVYGGREEATTFEQVDATLDLSGAADGNTIRIRNKADLPDELKTVSGIDHGIVVERVAGVWEAKSYQDSFDWIRVNGSQTFSKSRDVHMDFSEQSYIDSGEKFEFYWIDFSTTGSIYYKGKYFYINVADDDLPDYANAPEQDITWALLVPHYEDNEVGTDIGSVSKNTPLMLMDVGLPNTGKAATVDVISGIKPDTDVTLMNLKVSIGWMESL